MQKNMKKNINLAMLSAIAYVVMAVGRIPITSVDFLKYDPKDIIIAIAGFIYGPISALIVSFIVSVVEMLTLSGTGFIGLVMNVLSTACFACTAAFIYKKHRSLSGAVTGLISGSLLMVVMMLLWNYLITPIYMGYPRQAVAAMLIPVFLPFNLIKAALNTALTLLIYKPVVRTLRKAHIIEEEQESKPAAKNTWVIIISLIIIISCVLLILANNKII